MLGPVQVRSQEWTIGAVCKKLPSPHFFLQLFVSWYFFYSDLIGPFLFMDLDRTWTGPYVKTSADLEEAGRCTAGRAYVEVAPGEARVGINSNAPSQRATLTASLGDRVA